MAKDRALDERHAAIELKVDLEAGDSFREFFARESGLFLVSTKKILRFRSPDDLDPDKAYADAPWEQSLYLPHGSSDYVVARTIIQTARIASIFFPPQTPTFVSMMDVSWEVMNSLVSLRFIQDRLKNQVDRIVSTVEKELALYTVGKNPKPLPIVEYYDIEFRSFVNEVRRALTNICELFAILTPKAVPNGHFHEAFKWAKEVRGQDSHLATMLERDLRWVSTWIAMSVAIEHPKADRFIETMNFALEPNRVVRLPTWRFVHPDYDMGRPQNLLDVFDICIQNLLKFFEDLQIVLTDGHQPDGMGVEYEVIDEDKRDPIVPMRFAIRVSRG
jgi:hypothetical protein